MPTANTARAKRYAARLAAFLATLPLTACGTWLHDDIPDGTLTGFVTVDWTAQDLFIYRPDKNDPLRFVPSFWRGTNMRIEPKEMYTDGGSIPRFFWNIPGLSPWGMGPAYVVHDYIFAVHRCGWDGPVVAQITFEQSALVLAEIGKGLIASKVVKDDALNAIVWGVRTQYARNLWDTPGSPNDCKKPPPRAALRGQILQTIRFKVPPLWK